MPAHAPIPAAACARRPLACAAINHTHTHNTHTHSTQTQTQNTHTHTTHTQTDTGHKHHTHTHTRTHTTHTQINKPVYTPTAIVSMLRNGLNGACITFRTCSRSPALHGVAGSPLELNYAERSKHRAVPLAPHFQPATTETHSLH